MQTRKRQKTAFGRGFRLHSNAALVTCILLGSSSPCEHSSCTGAGQGCQTVKNYPKVPGACSLRIAAHSLYNDAPPYNPTELEFTGCARHLRLTETSRTQKHAAYRSARCCCNDALSTIQLGKCSGGSWDWPVPSSQPSTPGAWCCPGLLK